VARHVVCDTGLRAVGGGVEPVNRGALASGDFAVVGSYPTPRGTGWTALVDNNSPATEQFRIHVVCVS
jgi:hypothetical protein